jgi:hypothetical protein
VFIFTQCRQLGAAVLACHDGCGTGCRMVQFAYVVIASQTSTSEAARTNAVLSGHVLDPKELDAPHAPDSLQNQGPPPMIRHTCHSIHHSSIHGSTHARPALHAIAHPVQPAWQVIDLAKCNSPSIQICDSEQAACRTHKQTEHNNSCCLPSYSLPLLLTPTLMLGVLQAAVVLLQAPLPPLLHPAPRLPRIPTAPWDSCEQTHTCRITQHQGLPGLINRYNAMKIRNTCWNATDTKQRPFALNPTATSNAIAR